jgi:hypothetical protein
VGSRRKEVSGNTLNHQMLHKVVNWSPEPIDLHIHFGGLLENMAITDRRMVCISNCDAIFMKGGVGKSACNYSSTIDTGGLNAPGDCNLRARTH